MSYPRQIELGEEEQAKLASWIETELTNHFSERSAWVAQQIKYQQDYNAEPSSEVAQFPFVGASTIIVPLSAIALEATFSRTIQTLYALDQKIAARVFTEDGPKVETALENYLDQELFLPNAMNFKKKTESAILELHKLGTGVAVAEWEKVTRKGRRPQKKKAADKDWYEGKEEDFTVTVREGPTVDSVPLVNFLMPFDCDDPQAARWCGKVFWLTPKEISDRERDGFFKKGTYEDLSKFYTIENAQSDSSQYRTELEDQENRKPVWPTRVEFFQIYTSWDTSEDEGGWGDEICFIYHRDSMMTPAIWYNWYEDLRRPFRTGVYFPLENRWTGIGIGKQSEMFQMEMTAIHRQRLDNASIANLRMFKINRNATEIHDGEPLFPGKLWFVDDMEDVQSIEMGDVKVSAYNNENQVMTLAQQRNGVNELTLGMPQSGTPGTATDSAARVQESARKFDFTYNNCRTFLDQLIQDTLCNIVQFGPNLKRIQILERGAELELFLKQPYEMFRNQVYVVVGLVGQNQNQMLDRQNATQIAGMLQQYYTNMLGLATQLGDQTMIQTAARKAMEGANEALLQILPLHNIRNPKKFLIELPPANVQPTPVGGGQVGASPTTPDLAISNNNTNVLAPELRSILPAGAAGL